MALPKLKIVDKTEQEGLDGSYDAESNIHDELDVKVVLEDGSEKEVRCTLGETIFNVKKRLSDRDGVEWELKWYHGDKLVPDPLSLNDIAGFTDNAVLHAKKE
eukprot:TRINITY_DN2077_c0_g1_i1.p3 TRINITY_DN2077_c0_g1~~TRINITY_DN2077_c0_g1_i1.p3  ORF type:complete len:112 (+),score=57.25 TRINITY_DN2077_c0_g1_i1:28-336(+)